VKKLFNWRILNTIKLWGECISAYPNSDMQLLESPFTELCFGIIKLQSMNLKFLPFHLKVIDCLNNLSAKTHKFIPTTLFCLEILGIPDFQIPAKSSEEKLFEYELAIKIPKKQLKSLETFQIIIQESLDQILKSASINCGSPSFPEFCIPILHALKKLRKMIFSIKYKKRIEEIIDLLESQGKLIAKKRIQEKISPADIKKLDEFRKKLEKEAEKSEINKEILKIKHEKEEYRKNKIIAEKEK